MNTIHVGVPAKMHGGHLSSTPLTPSKLMKRKSLGFVQLRRGFVGHPGVDDENEQKIKEGKRSVSGSAQQPQQGKYGGLGIGRVNAADLGEGPFPRGVEPTDESGEEDDVEMKQEHGSGGFMRRLSLSGQRHKRTKNGVSLGGVAEVEARVLMVPAREDTTTPKPGLKQRQQQQEKERQAGEPSSPTPEVPPLPLLPPIELQPPSPPQTVSPATGVSSPPPSPGGMLLPSSPRVGLGVNSSPLHSGSTVSITSSPQASPISPSRRSIRTPGSPQSASLGRSTIVPSNGAGAGSGMGEKERATVLRRNSLGDLKIPERISQAQIGLKRDLGMVREFAANIERMFFMPLKTFLRQLILLVRRTERAAEDLW